MYNFGSNTSIRMIVKSYYPRAHPMHMHGHNFQILAEGFGDWNGRIAHSHNAQRRDVQLMPPSQGTTITPNGTIIEPGIPSYMGMAPAKIVPFVYNQLANLFSLSQSSKLTQTILVFGHS